MKLRLFHKIGEGGEDSAAVRQFVVENQLQDLIEFSNVKYEDEAQALFELAGPSAVAPVLVVDHSKRGGPVAIAGKSFIIDWLRTNILCHRD